MPTMITMYKVSKGTHSKPLHLTPVLTSFSFALFLSLFYFLSLTDEVQSAGGKVLVHCQAGVSRSVTITVAYIMLHSRMSMMDAFKYVKSCRSIVAPNFNFMGQLMEFEKCLESGNIVRNLGVDLGIPSRV